MGQHTNEMDALTGVPEGPWFHNLHLPDGRQTAPEHRFGDFPNCKWQPLAPHLPRDMTGMKVLDVGCNAGFYSFELARRGAEVTAMDHDPRYLAQARWAVGQMGLAGRVTFLQRDAYSLLHCREHYDLIFFAGVFYHLRYPQLVLDAIARIAPDWLVFQTLCLRERDLHPARHDAFDFDARGRMEEQGWPRLAFISDCFSRDPTNWWAPNRACVHTMLQDLGFAVTAEPVDEFFICRRRGEMRYAPLLDKEWRALLTALTDDGN